MGVRVQKNQHVGGIDHTLGNDGVQIERSHHRHRANMPANGRQHPSFRIALPLPGHGSVQADTGAVYSVLLAHAFQQLVDETVQVLFPHQTTTSGPSPGRISGDNFDIVVLLKNFQGPGRAGIRVPQAGYNFPAPAYFENRHTRCFEG